VLGLLHEGVGVMSAAAVVDAEGALLFPVVEGPDAQEGPLVETTEAPLLAKELRALLRGFSLSFMGVNVRPPPAP